MRMSGKIYGIIGLLIPLTAFVMGLGFYGMARLSGVIDEEAYLLGLSN
jgi:hypothetical protein